MWGNQDVVPKYGKNLNGIQVRNMQSVIFVCLLYIEKLKSAVKEEKSRKNLCVSKVP